MQFKQIFLAALVVGFSFVTARTQLSEQSVQEAMYRFCKDSGALFAKVAAKIHAERHTYVSTQNVKDNILQKIASCKNDLLLLEQWAAHYETNTKKPCALKNVIAYLLKESSGYVERFVQQKPAKPAGGAYAGYNNRPPACYGGQCWPQVVQAGQVQRIYQANYPLAQQPRVVYQPGVQYMRMYNNNLWRPRGVIKRGLSKVWRLVVPIGSAINAFCIALHENQNNVYGPKIYSSTHEIKSPKIHEVRGPQQSNMIKRVFSSNFGQASDVTPTVFTLEDSDVSSALSTQYSYEAKERAACDAFLKQNLSLEANFCSLFETFYCLLNLNSDNSKFFLANNSDCWLDISHLFRFFKNRFYFFNCKHPRYMVDLLDDDNNVANGDRSVFVFAQRALQVMSEKGNEVAINVFGIFSATQKMANHPLGPEINEKLVNMPAAFWRDRFFLIFSALALLHMTYEYLVSFAITNNVEKIPLETMLHWGHNDVVLLRRLLPLKQAVHTFISRKGVDQKGLAEQAFNTISAGNDLLGRPGFVI